MMRELANSNTVTLNLFQGPFIRSSSGCAARWMLKQVQHDEVVWEVAA
jgi:hypothetical protein